MLPSQLQTTNCCLRTVQPESPNVKQHFLVKIEDQIGHQGESYIDLKRDENCTNASKKELKKQSLFSAFAHFTCFIHCPAPNIQTEHLEVFSHLEKMKLYKKVF
jgi:hypothetical protein